jgi:hypothetical protein
MYRSSAVLVFVSTAALATASWAAGPAPVPATPPAPSAPTQIPGLPTPPPSDEDQAPRDQSLLGQAYENQAAGIAFRAPAGTVRVPKAPGDAELAEFYDQKRGWDFKVALSHPDQPTELTTQTAPDGTRHDGLLELTLAQVKRTNPGAEVLRSDVTNIGEAQVGMIALRYTQGTQRRLTQLAIVQKSKFLFYIFNLTTPGAKPQPAAATQPADAGPQDDPTEVAAVHTFTQVLDSLKFLDQSAIREDQVQRLFRTRNLFRNWTNARVTAALVPEQWLRVLRDGKDVGYSYIVERPEHRGNANGIQIGIRSRTRSKPGTTVDAEIWMYSNIDRKHESWSNVVRLSDTANPAKATNYGTEIGSSDALLESHPLTVKTVGKNANAEPLTRELPPWYLPQAISHLLPRLIPLNEAKTYMFANYVSDQHEVMSRYVDVQRERDVTLNGEHLRAIPIADRLGLQGVPTYHYFSPDGKYLGSETTLMQQSPDDPTPHQVKLLILPTTAEELNRIWDKPNLTAPSAPPDAGSENVQSKAPGSR